MYRKTYIEIDGNKFSNNIKNIVNTFNGYKYYIGVVKGNAYGFGEYVTKYMVENGINYLAVSSIEEAINVRKYVTDTPVLCLEPIDLEYIDEIIKYNITITVCNYEYFKKLLTINKKIKFHLKLNTGMNRLGINSKEEVLKIFDKSKENKNLLFEGIFTHLATSGVYDTLFNRQINNFKELTSLIDISKIPIVHVGRSATLDFFPKLDFCNGVRIGIMAYGVESTFPNYGKGIKNTFRKYRHELFVKRNNLPKHFNNRQINLERSLSLKSTIIDIHPIKKGEYVGYGVTNKVSNDGYIAVIPLGYSDGINPNYNNLKVKINNNTYSVVGTINMGMITILVDDKVKIGDIVTIINSDNDYKKYAKMFNVSPYYLLTNLKRELPRIYYKNGKVEKVIEYEI